MKLPLYAILPPRTIGRAHHYTGLPSEVSQGADNRQSMPAARILLIENDPPGVLLFRFASNGSLAGDTWHQSLDDAHHQAACEFEGTPIEWRPVPPEHTDLEVFIEQLVDRLNPDD